jgi:hypothetical protein
MFNFLKRREQEVSTPAVVRPKDESPKHYSHFNDVPEGFVAVGKLQTSRNCFPTPL